MKGLFLALAELLCDDVRDLSLLGPHYLRRGHPKTAHVHMTSDMYDRQALNLFTSGYLALWFVNRFEEFFSGWSLTTVFIILSVPFSLRF